MTNKPAFLITIDTEGDDCWSRSVTVRTKNASFLPRFQDLCEQNNLKPTYLTNYEMATSKVFQSFGRQVVAKGTGEIGMHLHAWSTPPAYQLTENDGQHLTYLVDYPIHVMKERTRIMTTLLEDTFGVKMVSHRAGRWAFNESYASVLIENGYRVDCSVTPHVSWRGLSGAPRTDNAPDYRSFPRLEYFVDLSDISQPGNSTLLEVPMTIRRTRWAALRDSLSALGEGALAARILNRIAPSVVWLRPNGRNLSAMLRLLDDIAARGENYAMFMLHSSELMPGGSPRFLTEHTIEKLYRDLNILFSHAAKSFQGLTLEEYCRAFERCPMSRQSACMAQGTDGSQP